MLVHEYLDAKYGGRATTLLYCEAKAIGMPYPPPSGWLATYGMTPVTPEIAARLRAALERSSKASAPQGLRVLAHAFPRGKTML